jgi:hypothetical protein
MIARDDDPYKNGVVYQRLDAGSVHAFKSYEAIRVAQDEVPANQAVLSARFRPRKA